MKKILLSLTLIIILVVSFSIVISAANLVDQSFFSTEGDLKWAFFETEGTLSYNNETYDPGTLVIYGTGTSYAYDTSKTLSGSNQSQYPWYSAAGGKKCPDLKTIIFDTPNLESLQKLPYLESMTEIYLPSSVTSLLSSQFAGCYLLKSIKIVDENYSEYGDGNIYDLRNFTITDYSFSGNIARDVEENITVLVGENAPQTAITDTTQFVSSSYQGTLNVVADKGTAGATWANALSAKAGNGAVTNNINVVYSNLIDQPFASSEGDLKWAFINNDKFALPYNGKIYAPGTLVIYGTGTSFAYSTPIKSTDRTGYPWYEVAGNTNSFPELKTIIFDAPNLESLQVFAYFSKLSEIYLPASITSLEGSQFLGCYSLKSIKIVGVDYSAYGNGNIYDLRNLKIQNYSFGSVARDVTENITVLVGENAPLDTVTDSTQFAASYQGTFTVLTKRGTAGETWAKDLFLKAGNGSIAANIVVDNYVKSGMAFDGFQVRTTKYNGLRVLFSFDKTAVNSSATCVEYGAILASVDNKELYGTELTLNNGEYVTSDSHIVKKAITKNGEFVNKVVSYNDNSVEFCVALVGFVDNWKSDIYACGYEIWQYADGSVEIIYTDVYDSEKNLYTPSIYDTVLLAFTKGVVNSADEDDKKVLWEVLENCSNSVLEHETADVNIHLFTASRADDVAIITGSGDLKDVYTLLNAAGKLSATTGPVTIVIDHGFASIGTNTFKQNKALETLVYPDGITAITGMTTFTSCDALTTVFKKGTQAVVGTVDLSYIGSVKLDYMFNGDKPNIEYIHLPMSFGEGVTEIPVAAFRKCTALKAIWCGNNAKPADGTADFTGTTITSAYTNTDNDSAFAFVSNITNFVFAE